MAKSTVFCIENELDNDIYNVGYGSDISIKELSLMIQEIVGHKGDLIWDSSKPDGTPKKLMDSSKLNEKDGNLKLHLNKEFQGPTIGI